MLLHGRAESNGGTMERELLITGIGGQGVQLAAQVIAKAAALEGRDVMFFGIYGGMMRGGNTDSTVVVADGPIMAPPVVSRAWSAIAMHDEFWAPLEPRLRPEGIVLVNDSTFEHEITAPVTVQRIPATELAAELDNPLGGSMVMAGAYAAMTGLVGLDALVDAMRESVPSYRRQHVEANERTLAAGWATVPEGTHPAWDPRPVATAGKDAR
jgi:Pyruvate/2-oxoacid:ferredoxin oxidoreductase gamma subunit